MNPTGAVVRWTVSVSMLIALAAITAATLHWYQPLRALFDEYLSTDVAPDNIVEPESVPRPHLEVQSPADFVYVEEQPVLESVDQDSDSVQEILAEKHAEVPFAMSVRDVFSERGPIDWVRIELQFAIVSTASNLDFTLATDALERARSIAFTEGMSQSLIESINQSLEGIDQLRKLNLQAIQDRLDRLSKLVLSMRLLSPGEPSADSPDTSLFVSEEPESRSLWNELSDGITSVYRVRRIDESPHKVETFALESSTQLRLLVILERARTEIRVFDFESYRASMTEAIAIVSALNHENPDRFGSIGDELLDLLNFELSSPFETMVTALELLKNETLTQGSDPTTAEQ